ncbi:MAG: carbohydrate-binding family 9-like protein, partial [Treponema sp.]|nr:carbohydrate-binding family 9-like protein [Treponema sp.]
RVASLWDERSLYLAYWVEEPAVRASLTERDSFVWYDNDVEVFIDGEDCYYELEINAFNTVYEVFFIYQDALKKGSRFDTGEFDLRERNVDVLSGFQDPTRYGKHRRGKRWAFMDFDFPGLKTAVQVQGKINDPGHLDKGWTVEIALPWEGFRTLLPGRAFPPKAGDCLRAAFFRFQALRYNGKDSGESAGWALNEHGAYDSHIPENFSYLRFED